MMHYNEIIQKKGGGFISLIHISVDIRDNVTLGEGVLIGPGAIVSTDCSIGDHTQICSYTVIGHDVKIGDNCRIGDFVFIGGFAEISNNVFLAVRSTVLAKVKIGKNTNVGASSLVIRNIKEDSNVFGIPATKLNF
jgi:UDP-3-O-[3-hydroxymyristoyl] glucosamine N-acyltransferase